MSRTLFLVLGLALCAPAAAQLKLGSADNLLEPEKAFRFSARAAGDAVEVSFAIADGYYLYRERFRFDAQGDIRLGKPEFPPGIAHKDEFFGEMQIYRKQVRILVPAQGAGTLDLKVTSQGCADVGVCYVPMESRASIRLTAAGSTAPARGLPTLSIFASDFEIARLFEGSFPFVIAVFLGFGLLLTFTPCVL
ncbi:MAG TPA: protein-disulfide reductase DsbD domain-containing protein, partial [Burkholderiales bacterium]|nr:protein-disulfide reductase DsbD domain-containing protein [Burkholderiales bacterium]